MTDTTAPRTAAAADHIVAWERLSGSPVAHDIAEEGCDGCAFINRTRAEAIEPLLALVRAADVLAECIGIDDYYETVSWPVDADGNSSSDEADRAAHVFAETLRALPESVRVAARKPE